MNLPRFVWWIIAVLILLVFIWILNSAHIVNIHGGASV